MLIEEHNTFSRIKINDDKDATWLQYFLNNELTTYTFAPDYSQMVKGRPKWVREVHKQFYIVLGRWYHIPAGYLQVALDSLQSSNCKVSVVRKKAEYKTFKVLHAMAKGYKPRGYQGEGIDKLFSSPSPILINGMATGMGKTISTMFMLPLYNTRTFLAMRPVWIKQWIEELLAKTTLKKEDILHVKNGNELRALFTKTDIKEKVIIISNSLYRNYVKEYIASVKDDDEEFSYDVTPLKAMEFLKVGLLVIDEVDIDFHSWSVMLMTIEIHKVIALSATMVSLDETMTKLFDNFVPDHARYDLFEEHPYISLFNYTYEFMRPKKVKWQLRGGYNHGVLEDYICDTVSSKNSYMKAVCEAYKVAHVNRCKPKEKCLVYFYKISTIEAFVEYMTYRFPKIKILTFIAGISTDELKSADLIVSTAGKAGRGLDIAGLTTIINTINIKSPQTNLQLYGRLRPSKDKESEKIAVQIGASNLNKHVEYNTARHSMLKRKVKRTSLIKSNLKV